MAEHNNYAVDFINACSQIKRACPGCKISGGVSNIAFSFRGNEPVRRHAPGSITRNVPQHWAAGPLMCLWGPLQPASQAWCWSSGQVCTYMHVYRREIGGWVVLPTALVGTAAATAQIASLDCRGCQAPPPAGPEP